MPFSVSVCIPLYSGSHLLPLALESLARQRYSISEVIIGDDNPAPASQESAKCREIAESFASRLPIIYHRNPSNLGYAKNLKNLAGLARADIIFLLAQDDILSEDALVRTMGAFELDPDVGVVTRPYYWFMTSVDQPVRAIPPYDPKADEVLTLLQSKEAFLSVFSSVGQLSGLAYRREFLTVPFNEEVFPAHIYPFAGIWRDHKCVFLKDYTVAVGILDSQTRSVSSIYDLSPTESWLRMYRTVFGAPQYAQAKAWGEAHMTTNFIGLVQLKNYAKRGALAKEICILLRERPLNWIDARFWFFALGSITIPRPVLRWLVDLYKARLHRKSLPGISFRPAMKS